MCHGFLSQEEPHLWLNLGLGSLPQEQSRGGSEEVCPSHFLTIRSTGNGNKNSELKVRVTCSDLIVLFSLALQFCVRSAILAKQPPDLLLHAAGIVREGLAYLFVGPSGAGKSTVCKLSADDSDFTILHDDIVAVTQTEGMFHAFSTPFRGERPAESSIGAPLRAVFFLKQDRVNYTTRLNGWQTVSSLAPQSILPLISKNGRLTIEPAESLKLLLTLVESVPSYELHFRPDNGFWKCIQQLPDGEAAGMVRKGER